MKIQISTKNRKFGFRMPLVLIKSKLGEKFLQENGINVDARSAYDAIKDYVKRNGHFVLLEVNSDETTVKIVV